MKFPRVALASLGALFLTGAALHARLSEAEETHGRIAGAASSHLFHGILGLGLGLFLAQGFREKPEATAWVCFTFAVGLLVVAVGAGLPVDGLPYVVAGPLQIHATEWLAVLALLPASWFLTGSLGTMRALAVFSPVMILSSVGGPTAVWSYFLGIAAMWSLAFLGRATSSGKAIIPLATLVPAGAIAFMPIARYVRKPPESAPTIYDGWVLSDTAAGAHAHTEFVLGALRALFGEAAPFLALALIAVALVTFARGALASDSQQARLLGIGFTAYAIGQVAWNVGAARALLPTPASGVALPFVSYTGTITLVSTAILVVVVSLHAAGARAREHAPTAA